MEFNRRRKFMIFAETHCIFCHSWGVAIFPNTCDGYFECPCGKRGGDPIAYWNGFDYSIHGKPVMYSLAEIESHVRDHNAEVRRSKMKVVNYGD